MYNDQYARAVVVCCESAVSYLACMLAGLFTYFSFLVGWLVGWFDWLVSFLLACLFYWLVDWLVCLLLAYLVVCLLTCSFARSLACLLFWFALLAYFDLLCLVDLRGSRKHQKLNQTTPNGVV